MTREEEGGRGGEEGGREGGGREEGGRSEYDLGPADQQRRKREGERERVDLGPEDHVPGHDAGDEAVRGDGGEEERAEQLVVARRQHAKQLAERQRPRGVDAVVHLRGPAVQWSRYR
jgi:hypothetical protein